MRTIEQIDADIDAVIAQLIARHVINQADPASWQAAWDKEPALAAVHNGLYVERDRARYPDAHRRRA